MNIESRHSCKASEAIKDNYTFMIVPFTPMLVEHY